MGISDWLRGLGLERHLEAFEENGIDTDILQELEDADLREIGIGLGDRKRILKAIRGDSPAEDVSAPAEDSAAPTTDQPSPSQPRGARAERRHLTVMFADLVGSTELSANTDPEQMRDIIRAFQDTVTDEVKRHRGYVAKYMGDGILIYFGFPVASEYDAEAAVTAAMAVQQRVGGNALPDGAPMQVRIGIATGHVVVGDLVGTGEARERDVIGETPNLAARLQGIAAPNQIMISEPTRDLIGDVFELALVANPQLKGFAEGTVAFRVVGLSAVTNRFAARHAGAEARMYGREMEYSVLLDRWELACRGRSQVAALVSEAGMGKSLFANSLRAAVERDKGRSLGLQCAPTRPEDPLFPFLLLGRQLAGITPLDSDTQVFHKLASMFTEYGGDGEAEAALIANFRGLDIPEIGPAAQSSPQQLRAQTIEMIVAFLLRLADRAPLYLVVEDVQWIDPSSADALQHLFETMGQRPILVLMTSRPGGVIPQAGTLGLTQFTLEPLKPENLGRIVHAVAGDKALPPELVAQIVDKADGVPLFVEELTKTVLRSDMVEPVDGGFRLREGQTQFTVPSSLHDSLMARLDSFPQAKRIAQRAACIGRVFSHALLLQTSRVSPAELDVALHDLTEAGVIQEEQGEFERVYSFSHGLVSDIARESLLRTDQARIHGEIAEAMIANRSAPAMIARHLEFAGQPVAAAERLLEAARSRLQVSAAKEAVTFLRRGIALVEDQPGIPEIDLLRFRLWAFLGTSFMVLRSWGADEVEECYSKALAFSDAATDMAEKLWIVWGIWVFRQVRGELATSGTEAARIARIAADSGDATSRFVAGMVQVQAAFYSGRFEEAIDIARATEAIYDPDLHDALRNPYSVDLLLVLRVHAAQALLLAGRLEEAEAMYAQTEARVAEVDQAHSQVWTAIWGANYHLLRDAPQPVLDTVPEASRRARELGFDYVDSLGQMILLSAQLAQNSTDADAEALRKTIMKFEATGAGITIPYFNALLAKGLHRLGHSQEAVRLVDAALERVEALGEFWLRPLACMIRADILRITAPAEAETAYRRAIETADSAGAHLWAAQARLRLAGHLASQGHREHARKTLMQASAEGTAILERLTGRSQPDDILDEMRG